MKLNQFTKAAKRYSADALPTEQAALHLTNDRVAWTIGGEARLEIPPIRDTAQSFYP